MSCDIRTYDCDQTKFDQLRQKLSTLGVIQGTNQGTVTSPVYRITIGYKFDPTAGKLQVEVIDKPWLVGCGKILENIDNALMAV